MATVVGICNSALIKMGAGTIVSLTEGSKNANVMNSQYEICRDELLRSHPWNFAVTRAALARLSATPAFGFDYKYQLPSDWMRTVSVHDNDAGAGAVKYKIEGQAVLCSATSVYLRYVQKVTDPNAMDAQFREALAWRLAMDTAGAITQSNTVVEQMTKGFDLFISTAKGTDAIEDFPEQEPMSDWEAARY